MSSLESVWKFREETLYPQLFGERSNGIFTLDVETFTDTFGLDQVDPRWLHLGVFEFEPTPGRSSWLYVTSGGSTPWETEPSEYDPEEYSWLGSELVLEAPVQSEWAIRALLRLLAYQVMLCHGCFGEMRPLSYGHRVPAGGAINGKKSALQFIAIAEPDHYRSTCQLDSGKFDFLHAVGITETERDFAKATSTKKLISALKDKGAFPVTDPARESVK